MGDKPHIFLTSFAMSKYLPIKVVPWSAAVYQPTGFKYPKATWTDIREDGKWMRPRDFLDAEKPLLAYRAKLYSMYESRLEDAEKWLSELQAPAALCCWCPYDKAAQRQLQQWGSFVCHTAVVGEFLIDKFQLPVWYDGDRRKMSVLTQKGLPNEPPKE
ncbi:MAG TPA: hypothetical protein VJ742_13415 [Nitrososphaera sp.]|nr:hypothetical protein [Nitrososphaera sp.]